MKILVKASRTAPEIVAGKLARIIEKQIPYNMRYKQVDGRLSGDTYIITWWTQDPFNKEEAEIFFAECEAAAYEYFEFIDPDFLVTNMITKIMFQVDIRDNMNKKPKNRYTMEVN